MFSLRPQCQARGIRVWAARANRPVPDTIGNLTRCARRCWGQSPQRCFASPPAEEEQKNQKTEAQKFILLGPRRTGTRGCCARQTCSTKPGTRRAGSTKRRPNRPRAVPCIYPTPAPPGYCRVNCCNTCCCTNHWSTPIRSRPYLARHIGWTQRDSCQLHWYHLRKHCRQRRSYY